MLPVGIHREETAQSKRLQLKTHNMRLRTFHAILVRDASLSREIGGALRILESFSQFFPNSLTVITLTTDAKGKGGVCALRSPFQGSPANRCHLVSRHRRPCLTTQAECGMLRIESNLRRALLGTMGFGILAFLAIALPTRAVADPPSDSIRWMQDVDQALRMARAQQRPVLIHFYGDNCPPCAMLEKKAYRAPSLIETINTEVIPVHINADEDRKTASRFKVSRWPTDVYLYPNGEEIYRNISSQDPVTYEQTIDRVAQKSRDWMLENTTSPSLAARNHATSSDASQPARSWNASHATESTPAKDKPASKSLASRFSQWTKSWKGSKSKSEDEAALDAASQPPADVYASVPAPRSSHSKSASPQPSDTTTPAPKSPPPFILARSKLLPQSKTSVASPTPAPSAVKPPAESPAVTAIPMRAGSPEMIADQEKAAKEREAKREAELKLELEQRNFIYLASDASTENVAPDSDAFSSDSSTADASSSPVAAQMVSAPVSGSASTTPSPDDSATPAQPHSTQSDPSRETTATSTPSTATQPSTEEQPIATAPTQEPPVTAPKIAEPAVAPSATTEPANVAPTATATAIPTPTTAKQPVRASLRYEPVVKESIALQPALPDATNPVTPASESPALENSSPELSTSRPVATVAPKDNPAANKLVLAEVAMKGFCPVALHQAVRGNSDSSAGAWVLGNPAFAVRHRGRIYHCSSQEARETLLKSPDSFTPVLSGCDLVEFAKTGKWIDGECQFGFIEQRSGRVFLFSSRANYDEFARNCEAYSKMVGDSMRP